MRASPEAAVPRLHVLLSERELDGAGGHRLAYRLLDEAGPLGLHLRGRWSAARLHDHARRIAARAAEASGWCVVNGRPDIALAARAHAVQLGRAALEV
ncbi:MAG: hypothetical protein R3266_05460, partial [Gemmatimonadota bacterium]|nr:hypothetical protein [Gemmatimonadota bacterium]